jgi:hypothetical protein
MLMPKDNSHINFILVTSLKGLADNLKTHTDKIYYFLFNVNEEHMNSGKCLENYDKYLVPEDGNEEQRVYYMP